MGVNVQLGGRWLSCVILLGAYATLSASTASAQSIVQAPRPKLQRQQGKRWSRLDDIARAEIKSATRRFLDERNHVSWCKGGTTPSGCN
jgi:hypothetical protein